MRVVDLDRDMSDVIPTALSRDTLHLFDRMERETFDALRVSAGARVLDVAGGLGQDSRKLAERGIYTVCAEPSQRMHALGRQLEAEESKGPVRRMRWVRGWSEGLPFRDDAFDAAFCKGALDHFDDPAGCIAELARVTRPGGRVVLAVANFQSFACRLQRLVDRVGRGPLPAGRRPYHVPSDHFTRFDPDLLREQLEPHVVIEQWTGLSLLWGVIPWGNLLGRLDATRARRLLGITDRVAASLPGVADVIIAAGRPRSRVRAA